MVFCSRKSCASSFRWRLQNTHNKNIHTDNDRTINDSMCNDKLYSGVAGEVQDGGVLPDVFPIQ